MTRGRFISLEGGEGVGKSTQLDALAEALIGRGLTVIVTCGSGPKCEAALALGAAHAIDYSAQDFVAEVRELIDSDRHSS